MSKRTTVIIVFLLIICIGAWSWGITTLLPNRSSDNKPSDILSSFPPASETRYRMSIKLDPDNQILVGHSEISTKNILNNPLDVLWITTYPNAFRNLKTTPAPASAYYQGFNSGNLIFSSISVNGNPVLYKDYGISSKLVLKKPIAAGEKIKLIINWNERIPKVAYRYGCCNDVTMLGNFYPSLNVFDSEGWHMARNVKYGDPFCYQCASYSVVITMPKTYAVASTGEIISQRLYHNYQTLNIEANNVRDFAMAAMKDYQSSSIIYNGCTIKFFYHTAENSVVQETLARAQAAIQYYQYTFGAYPYPELDLVEVPMQGFQGMEHSGLIFFADYVFRPDFNKLEQAYLVAHEISHQWWFGLISCDQYKEPWLNEGLATWSADNYLQEVELREVNQSGKYKPVWLNQNITQLGTQQEYFNVAYRGGECFWRELERMLGKQTVLNILRDYLSQYRYKIATSADVQKVIEETSGKDLDKFYFQWFHTYSNGANLNIQPSKGDK